MSERTYEAAFGDLLIASGPGAGRRLSELLEEMAALMARVEHRLYVERYVRGRDANECKREFIAQFGITARQFNAVNKVLGGKVEGALGAMRSQLASLDERARSARSWIAKKARKVAQLTKQIADEHQRIHPRSKQRRRVDGAKLAQLVAERKRLRFQLHHKRRYLADLERQIARLEADLERNNPRLCFGGRRRFRAQFDLEANGYASHEAWLADWRQARANQVFLVGSTDEAGGNQSCTAMPDGTLRLRVPTALAATWGTWVCLPMPTFLRGDAEIVAAHARGDGISWRFVRKERGWRLQAVVDVEPAPIVTIPEAGAIGTDLNADHLASCALDRFGNPLPATARSLPLQLYKRSHAQVEAALGDAVAALVGEAKATKKPLVVERLDMRTKRARLREIGGQHYARMLSGFAYTKFFVMLRARCEREGVELIVVNPAYTSLIGLVKFAHGYGLSSHQAAAVAIGRRGMGPRRKVCKHEDRNSCGCAPVPEGLAERLVTKARTARSGPAGQLCPQGPAVGTSGPIGGAQARG